MCTIIYTSYMVLALFPGSSPDFCRMLGEKPGNEATYVGQYNELWQSSHSIIGKLELFMQFVLLPEVNLIVTCLQNEHH